MQRQRAFSGLLVLALSVVTVASCTSDPGEGAAESTATSAAASSETTTTTIAKSTTTLAPTTTMDPVDVRDLEIMSLAGAFNSDEGVRSSLRKAVQTSDFSIESVDVIAMGTTETTFQLQIAVTTGYNGVEYRDSTAWSIVSKSLAPLLWSDGDKAVFRNAGGKTQVGLQLTVDSTVYTATYTQMLDVADFKVSSIAWLNSARGA